MPREHDDARWERDYASALKAYLHNIGEGELERAYELGRAALARRVGVVDIVVAHDRVLEQLGLARDEAAAAFLAECLGPFEMASRGFQEAIATLRELNASLETRVEQRTRELLEAEERYRSLIEQVPAVTYRCATHRPWARLYVSPQLKSILGYEPEQWLADPQAWLEHLDPADRDRVVVQLERAIAHGTQFSIEYRLRTKAGHFVWVRDEAALLDGQPPVLQGIQLDVTEQRLLEHQLREAQRAESIGRLAGGVAHDFNNLLSIILSYAEILIRRLPEDDPIGRDLAEIRRAGERAASLTSKLLAYSRRQILESRVININQLVSEMQGMLRRVIGENIKLQIELDPDVHNVRVDPAQVEQVLLNLVINARDAMAGVGVLTLRTHNEHLDESAARARGLKEGAHAVLQVIDTGTGMPPEVLDRLFEPFFTTKPREKGTGLGLATSYGIVKQSGGSIEVESAVGQGTTFSILLPAADAVVTEPAVEAGGSEAYSGKVGGNETILVVEDEAAVRSVTARVLREHGYHVLQAGDGIEALVVANSYPDVIHLLLADVVMPGMSGKDLAEVLTAARPSMRTLFTTGYDEESVARGMLSSQRALMQKPVAPGALVQRVREILDGA